MRWSLTLIFVVFGYFVSLLVFQRGLLLKRRILSAKSNCADVILYNSTSCWLPAQFNRAIVLIVDALRYDFIDPKIEENSYFHGQMPYTKALLNAANRSNDGRLSSNARLFRFISDAPTTTFQRIKALVTGNIPTFIEASENFGASEIHEDNIVDQIVDGMRRNASFIGDDTWIQLLPNRFYRHFALPSFDIKDLETVDNLVIDKIYDEINRTDWSLIVAHVLGVDHCGHRYGPKHPEMRRKLRQTDELIYNITRSMADDTVLMVMGDHGMTEKGDHGGESRFETEAALFVFANSGFTNGAFNLTTGNTVEQVDFVPTLSLLLGIPIPFSSIGRVIDELFDSAQLNLTLKLNAVQVVRYSQEYASFDGTTQSLFLPVLRRFESASTDTDPNLNRDTIEGIKRVMRIAFRVNDLPMTLVGILSFVECILFNIYAVFCALDTGGLKAGISWAQIVFRSALFLLQLSLYFDSSLGNANGVDVPILTGMGTRFWRTDLIIFSSLTLAISILYSLAIIFMRLFLFKQIDTFQQLFVNYFKAWFCALCVLQTFTFGSNSFVIGETSILRVLLAVLLLFLLFDFLGKKRRHNNRAVFYTIFGNLNTIIAIAASLFILRSFTFFETCREENANCNEENGYIINWFNMRRALSNNVDETVKKADVYIYEKNNARVFLSIFILFGVNYFMIRRIRATLSVINLRNQRSDNVKNLFHSLNYNSWYNSSNSRKHLWVLSDADFASFGLTLTWPMCVCVALHWLCEFIEHDMAAQGKSSNATGWYLSKGRYSAQFVYFIAFFYLGMGVLITKFGTNLICFFGPYTIFKTYRQFIFIVLAMILGDWLAIGFCLFFVVFTLTEQIIAEHDFFIRTLFRYILGAVVFYALGHQCVFTSIPWNAAFVGLPGNFPIKAIAASLVLAHIFAGNIFLVFNIFDPAPFNQVKETYEKFTFDGSRQMQKMNLILEGIKQGSNVYKAEVLLFILLNAFRVLGCCVGCIFLWDNLMFFKIFAPKFIFEAANLIVCSVELIFLNLLFPE